MWSTESADLENITKVLSDNATKPLSMRSNTVCRFDIEGKKPRLLCVNNWQGFGSVHTKSADWFKSMGQTTTTGRQLSYRNDVWPINASDSFPDYEPTHTVKVLGKTK